MWNMLRRALLPVLVLVVGIMVLTYGVKKHTMRVFEEQEIEVSLVPPTLPGLEMPSDFGGPPGLDGLPGFGGMPGALPPFGAPPELRKVKQKILVGKIEHEMPIVRDVTIGGLMLLTTGELQRTYSGQPPSLCPT